MEVTPRIAAAYYHLLGLNATCICGESPAEPFRDSYKHPSGIWWDWVDSRQTADDLRSQPWEDSTGVGIVLGHDNVRALDFDFCPDNEGNLLHQVLSILGLPPDYEWAHRSRNGFHLVFKCTECKYMNGDGLRMFEAGPMHKGQFAWYELRWKGHLVVPPSQYKRNAGAKNSLPSLLDRRQASPGESEFYSGKMPLSPPAGIGREKLDQLILELSNIAEPGEEPFIRAWKGGSIVDEFGASHERPSLYLFFDTETTGVPRRWSAPLSDLANWPRLVQIAWIIFDETGREIESHDFIVSPDDFAIPLDASRVHGLTTEIAKRDGQQLERILNLFERAVARADTVVGHNLEFDEKIVSVEYLRQCRRVPFSGVTQRVCTMKSLTDYVGLPGNYGKPKWPTLSELHLKLFGEDFDGAHNALADIRATASCFWKAKGLGLITTV